MNGLDGFGARTPDAGGRESRARALRLGRWPSLRGSACRGMGRAGSRGPTPLVASCLAAYLVGAWRDTVVRLERPAFVKDEAVGILNLSTHLNPRSC